MKENLSFHGTMASEKIGKKKKTSAENCGNVQERKETENTENPNFLQIPCLQTLKQLLCDKMLLYK